MAKAYGDGLLPPIPFPTLSIRSGFALPALCTRSPARRFLSQLGGPRHSTAGTYIYPGGGDTTFLALFGIARTFSVPCAFLCKHGLILYEISVQLPCSKEPEHVAVYIHIDIQFRK